MIVDSGAIPSCAYWLVLFTIYRAVGGILLWRRKRKEKKSLKSSCQRGELGGVLEGAMATRMREIEARGIVVTDRVSSEYQKAVVMTRAKKD